VSKRCVHEVSEEQLARLGKVGLDPKRIGLYGGDAFEEWLKRREGRARRAALQIKKYDDLLKEAVKC